MKNREIIRNRLEKLDSTLTNLKRIVNTQEPLETYKANIDQAQSLVDEISSYVDREPKSNYEQNSMSR
jgi:5-bromo-4-chloroindolyl phosphate hydrolysis protein|tara:strand:+ start:922 stop:1125 length:204 start_codon:yes stop_codon:yes gene_type:complete